MSDQSLTLKWGTLKQWNLAGNEAAIALLQRYYDLGVSMSVMRQKDTPEQKDILCQVIDLLDAPTVWLDWEGIQVSKDDAKRYIREYGKVQA